MATGNCKVPRNEQPQFGVKLFEEDVRLIYNAVDFYLEHRVEEFDKTKKELPEPTEAVLDMEKTLNRMLLEFNFHSSNTDSV